MPDWGEHVRARLVSLQLSPTRENEIVEELSQHLEDRWRELVAGGASPEEATRLALAEFRGRDVLATYLAPLRQSQTPPAITPGVPAGRPFAGLSQDLRYAARAMWKQPGFAAVTILTLALGLGATTAIFSVVYGVLLKPLPFRDPERLVGVHHQKNNQGPGTYFTYRDHQRVFEDIGAWEENQVSITGLGEAERVEALSVTDATLPLLGVQPALGRLFTREDDAPGRPLRVVLTHGYWQRRFGGNREVVGRPIDVDGVPGEIIGVLPAAFKFLRTKPALLMPMQLDRADLAGFDFAALARLKPGVTLAQANADVARMIPLLPTQYTAFRLQPDVRPLTQDLTGDIGYVLWILLGTVAIVLLIACANVANLFLVRAEGRHLELAMRAALGASRGRLARQLLSESLLLGLAGGLIGLVFAQAGIILLRRMAPAELPRLDEIALHPTVLLFSLAVSILSGLLFGLVPVLRLGKPSAAALKEGGRAASDGPGRHRTRNALVVTEVALSVMLLIVSGLMIRTFVAMRQMAPGFTNPEQVQTFRLFLPTEVARTPQQVARTFEQIAERVAQVLGVTSVGLASSITMDGEDNGNPLFAEHIPVPDGAFPPFRRFRSVAPGYFETMGNRLVAGRPITWTDIHQARPVVIVSENLARELWQEPSKALGQRVRAGRAGPWQEVIGVVGNERDDGLNRPVTAMVYWPVMHPSYPRRTIAFAVRSSRVGEPGFVHELHRAVWSVNSNLPLAAVQTLRTIRADSMAQTSFVMVMLAIAASVALLLGVVGIYGVIAYIARQRTREIGTRMALGAQAGDVRRLFLRHGLVLTMTGIALGIGASMLLMRVMSALLFGVGPTDPLTYVAVAAGLTAIALLATYLPARRASRIDPIVALRSGM